MATVADQIRVEKHAGTSYAIFLADRRLGYVGLARPGGKNPISWLTKKAGGVNMEVDERVKVVERVQALMAEEWEKHEAALQRLRDLENGVATEAPAEESKTAKKKATK